MADEPKKILIVEDEEPLSAVLKDSLSSEGFAVTTASDGAQGLQAALDQKPDLILLDIIMPKLDGLSMLRQLRTYDAGRTIPVIVMSNLSDSKEVHEALANGARDFMVKSDWAVSDLVATIRRHLNDPTASV